MGGVSSKDKILLAENLATMLRSGLTIAEAFEILVSQARGKTKFVINSLAQSLLAGNSLAASLEQFPKVFSSYFINTVKAGEASGNLENNLAELATQLGKRQELNDKIKQAMFYPVIVLVLSFVMGLALSFLVLPKITPLFAGLKVDLPITTKLLISFSELIENNGGLIFLGIIIVICAGAWLFRQKFIHPLTHYLWLHLPIIRGISRNRNIAQFFRMLGALLKSGLSIDEAINISVLTVKNYYYRRTLNNLNQHVGQGQKIAEYLHEHEYYFPRLAVSLIKVGEKSGKLEEELFNVAEIYEKEVDKATKLLATAVEPILLVFIGLVVGVLALSIITPIYSITGNVN